MAQKHTIVLIQPTNIKSRTFFDYANVSAAVDGICQVFEAKLKQNSNQRNITYSVSDLYKWIDTELSDISALVFEPNISAYVPHDKEWIKKRVFEQLKRQANQ